MLSDNELPALPDVAVDLLFEPRVLATLKLKGE